MREAVQSLWCVTSYTERHRAERSEFDHAVIIFAFASDMLIGLHGPRRGASPGRTRVALFSVNVFPLKAHLRVVLILRFRSAWTQLGRAEVQSDSFRTLVEHQSAGLEHRK